MFTVVITIIIIALGRTHASRSSSTIKEGVL